MAGAGFKTFATGEVLTASDVNTYLMQQTVMVFADATARSTALGANVAEGMLSYLKSTKETDYYNGSAWVVLSTGGDITAVTAGTGLSGGGTSGDVTLNLANTAVTSGSYTNTSLTVDAQGRLTAASSGTAPVTSVIAGSGISVTGTTTPTVALDLTAANVYTAAQTATRFIVTGSTVATNGMYLPASNTLGFSTNSVQALRLDSNGNLNIGSGATVAGRSLTIQKNLTGATVGYGISVQQEIQSDVTTAARVIRTFASTQATAFTLSNLQHFFVSNLSLGATSAVTTQIGYYAEPLSGATNNFAFQANSVAASNNWNFYAGTTAANYFAGRTGIGGSVTSIAQFGVTNAQSATDVTAIFKSYAAQTADAIKIQNSAGTDVFSITPAGLMKYVSGNTATTVGAAGGASALPATPTGYLKIDIGGTEYKVPYYAA